MTALLASRARRRWLALGLDVPTVLMMIKAALPPTIAVAMYQADTVAAHYGTLGYLIAIISVLGFAILPRGKFVQTMLINVFVVCFASAMGLLAILCATQARASTTPPGQPLAGYNSSASAVCAVWLFFQIYVANSIKSARPQLQFPVVLYSIFTNITLTSAPQLADIAAGMAYIEALLSAFLTGFAISTGVSLFILPVSSRKRTFEEIKEYIAALKIVIDAQMEHMRILTRRDASTNTEHSQHEVEILDVSSPVTSPKSNTSVTPTALKKSLDVLLHHHAELKRNVTFAKREVAWGKLSGSDIGEVTRLLRQIQSPIIATSIVLSIAENFDDSGLAQTSLGVLEAEKNSESRQNPMAAWRMMLQKMQNPCAEQAQALVKGLDHVLLTLDLQGQSRRTPKFQTKDVEAKAGAGGPDRENVAAYLEDKSGEFRNWNATVAFPLPGMEFLDQQPLSQSYGHGLDGGNRSPRDADIRQLCIVLHLNHLLSAASDALLELVRFVDLKSDDGTLKRSRFHAPSFKQLKKWVRGILMGEDESHDEPLTIPDSQGHVTTVHKGDSTKPRKEPDHLPAESLFQRSGNLLRALPRLLRSEHSAFGFRVACATMSIAILAYLATTHDFFVKQRLRWAMNTVAISMSRTAGKSLLAFIFRLLGTALAMVASFVIYYIVDGKTAGVVVFLWLFLSAAAYFFVKVPKFLMVALLFSIAILLIVGYELQVAKIGAAAAASSGQPVYPTYELGPYRLAVVAGGVVVAYFWTIFPYPVTEHSELRRELGVALDILANHYSVVHETVTTTLRRSKKPDGVDLVSLRQLEKFHRSLFSKELVAIHRAKAHSASSKWQVSLGGRFPKATYDAITRCTETIFLYTALVGYVASSMSEHSSGLHLEQAPSSSAATSQDAVALLMLLSSSLLDARPLPPRQRVPEPPRLASDAGSDAPPVGQITASGAGGAAVVQAAGQVIASSMRELADLVKSLVGELDYSFTVVSTTAASNGMRQKVQDGKHKES